MSFSPQELEFIEILTDPVKFALYHFGWEAYPYQAAILREPGNRKITRWGRRSGKTDVLSVFPIWYAFTHGADPDDPKSRPAVCLIAAPYENQVKLIFKRIRELISKSPEIQDSIAQNTKHPEYIEFKNGSCIAGFTAGTKAGSGGASLRGQRADWLIVDEMDYMTDEDLVSIVAIAADKTVDTGIWLSSTPTGRRSKFFEYCVEAQGGRIQVPPGIYRGKNWVVSYNPSTEHPGWKKDPEKNEAEWKSLLGEDGYIREILAEFGVEAVGVFNKEYIDRAKRSYEYPKKVKKGPVRVVGVDWDKVQATPTLLCLEYVPDEVNSFGEKGMFKVINRMSIPRQEFTLEAAVNEIVAWNAKYDPEWIYVDRGFGEYQVERLHLLGKEALPGEDAYGLDRKVVGVSLAEMRDVKDPGSGELVKKPIKPWMVNQTVIMFEKDRIILSKQDETLWKQLENYRVTKVSVDGRPTYTSVNEHSVDALCLCVLAIVDKLPELTRVVQRFDPTRIMAVAPPLHSPVMKLTRGEQEEEEDEEEFVSRKVKENNVQTWFRVDDIRDVSRSRNVDKTTWNLFKNSPFVPRGTPRGRHTSRSTF